MDTSDAVVGATTNPDANGTTNLSNNIICKVEIVEGDHKLRESEEDSEEEGPRTKLTCSDCSFETFVGSSFKRHCTMHVRQRLSCHLCDAHYMDQGSLARHLQTHDGGQGALLPCPKCDTHFTRQDTLEQHMMMHAQPEKPFKCSVCKKSFMTYKEMRAHKSGHGIKAPYVCEVCGKGYLQHATLAEHRFNHEEERKFPCVLCGKRFFNPMALKRHERVHTGERPFRCLTCGLNFGIRSNLIAHNRTHTGERPFPCPSETCPQAFSTSSAAKRHFLRIHLKGARKTAAKNSGGTGQTSGDGGDGEDYILGCTDDVGGTEKPAAPTPYICKQCGASFKTHSGRWAHERAHIVVRPFSCLVCPQAFASMHGASRHLRKVHNMTSTARRQAV